jgi:hypothetical protein
MARLASQFVALPPERRALAFTQTAARMAVSSVMVEKDFWVSWLLGLLFADPDPWHPISCSRAAPHCPRSMA